MDNSDGLDSAYDAARRDFLTKLSSVLGSLIALLTAIPAVGYLVAPAVRSEEDGTWIEIGPLHLVPDAPVEFRYLVKRREGWLVRREFARSFADRTESGDLVVFSSVCTHLGCGVFWNPERRHYHCPCHDGIFARDGRVLGGPPPRPLDRLEAKEKEGVLWIRV